MRRSRVMAFTSSNRRCRWSGPSGESSSCTTRATLAAALDGHHLALHGHTHRRHIERETTHLVFNPGECAGHIEGHNAIGIVDLVTMAPEIIQF